MAEDLLANIGIIEGFYGRPWRWEDRWEYAAFLNENHFRFYIYAPKDDAYLRKQWQEPWPAERLEKMIALADHFHQAGVKFGIGLSPYEIYLDDRTKAKGRLSRKMEELNAVDYDILCVLFDDMQGDLPQLAEKQVAVVHHIAELSRARTLVMCPTYYSYDPILTKVYGTRPMRYLEELGSLLDLQIHLFWTGPLVCSSEYPVVHLTEVAERLQRKPFLWDNYPVNDGAKLSQFLHLRAFTNRPAQLKEWTSGHAVNPMNQAWLSRIPLRTLPESYSLEARYSPQQAFADACHHLKVSDVGHQIHQDVTFFQEQGLTGMVESTRDALVVKYQKYKENPYAQEIVAWLLGEYAFDPACLTD